MPFRAEFESTSNRTRNPQLGYGFSWGTESQTRTRTLGNPCAKPARVALPVPCPIRNRLSAESTRALICLNNWTKLGYVKEEYLKDASKLPEVVESEMEVDDSESDGEL